MVVTFFGHRNTPIIIEPVLERTLTDLIVNENADKLGWLIIVMLL